ncbi:MAG: DNA cytosine methyltransferase [Rhizomicrobium sp.]
MHSILDVFSGCGGFSLGAHAAGFSTALAVDSDQLLSSSFPINFPKTKLLREDVRNVDGAALKEILPHRLDGVVGGPPCQAFSEMGRRAADDPRRELVLEYFRIVKLVRPKFFVFENVRGLGFEQNINLLEAGLELLPSNWTILGPQVLNAADFGAPTRRLRLFVFGFDRNEMNVPLADALFEKTGVSVFVKDAISDLLTASPLGEDGRGFDIWKYDRRRTVSEYAARMHSQSGQLTGHRKTVHTPKTLKRFRRLLEGQNDKIGKYTRLSWEGFCPTLRAGTGSDRGSYQAVRPIHPTEHRVITPREAARLQGFPDGFLFHPTVWHSCRMIGNSVSPIIAKTLLQRVAKALENVPMVGLPLAAE